MILIRGDFVDSLTPYPTTMTPFPSFGEIISCSNCYRHYSQASNDCYLFIVTFVLLDKVGHFDEISRDRLSRSRNVKLIQQSYSNQQSHSNAMMSVSCL